MKGIQYRIRVNGDEWGQWQWLPEELSWSGVYFRNIRLEFRWSEIPLYEPAFTK